MTEPVVRVVNARVPQIRIDDLTRLLRKSLGWKRGKAEAAISAFIYEKGARDGGWSRPLLPVGIDSVNICFPLMAIHPTRLIEHWLIQGGFSEAERGRLYENYLRDELQCAIRQNPILRNVAYICLCSIDIPTRLGKRDIDLLVRIGTTIFIGEIKALSRPLMPWEQRSYMEGIFSKAPEQLRLRRESIHESASIRSVLASKTLYTGCSDELRFVYAIVSTHPEGAGWSVNGIAIIDWISLREYFTSNVYEMVWTSNGRSAFDSNEVKMNLYQNDIQAAERLELYLQMSPRSAGRLPFLANQPIRGDDPVRGSRQRVECEQWFVRPYSASELSVAARSLSQAWNDACLQRSI